jgi:hypothetical protein
MASQRSPRRTLPPARCSQCSTAPRAVTSPICGHSPVSTARPRRSRGSDSSTMASPRARSRPRSISSCGCATTSSRASHRTGRSCANGSPRGASICDPPRDDRALPVGRSGGHNLGTNGHKSRWYGVVEAGTRRGRPARATGSGKDETPGRAAFSAAHQGLRRWHPQRDSNPCRHLERQHQTRNALQDEGIRHHEYAAVNRVPLISAHGSAHAGLG